MNAVKAICITVIICWTSLMLVLVYAIAGHELTRVERFTTVEVRGK